MKKCPMCPRYKFKTTCRVTTCKMWTPITASNCLAIDIKFSAEDKPFSDGELLHYKFSDKELSVKDIAKIRRQAVDRVKGLIMLSQFILTLKENPPQQKYQHVPGKSKVVDAILNTPPLSLPRLEFESWMLPLIFDTELAEATIGKKFRLKDALQLGAKEFSAVERDVFVLQAGGMLFDNVV